MKLSKKKYNLEFLSTRHYLSQQLEAMLAEHNFHPHRALRKGANTIYIKAADHIEDLLTFMGAGGAAMRIMDQRMYNDMRNKTNRLSNCETANLGKSVQAARGSSRPDGSVSTGWSRCAPARCGAAAQRTRRPPR